VNVKTRKRNVAVPLDPAGFADSVLTLFETHCSKAEGVEAKLAAAGKALESADLDFSRYGDTLFEIYFAGARMGIGAKLAGDEKQKIDFNVRSWEAGAVPGPLRRRAKPWWSLRAPARSRKRASSCAWPARSHARRRSGRGGDGTRTQILACAPDSAEILPFIRAFAGLLRRRPFLVKRLETVVCKLLTSLEFFDEQGRKKIAIGALRLRPVHRAFRGGLHRARAATALMFTEKIAIQAEEVLESLLNDRLVAKGTVLEVLTHIMSEFLQHAPIEELITLLTRAKVAHRLLDFFPPGRQNEAALEDHFKQAGLDDVVRAWAGARWAQQCHALQRSS